MPNEHRLTDNDVIDLLTDAGEHVAFPPIPDFSASFRRQARRPGETGDALRYLDAPTGPKVAGDTIGTPSGEWSSASNVGTGWRQAARLVAAGTALLVVGLVVVVLLRETRDDSNPAATTGGAEMRDVLISTFSASTGPDEFYSYLLIRDAETLETIHRIPVDLGGWFTVSPDGTRIYAAGDLFLTAVDTGAGGTVWEVPLTNRHLRELGIPGLAAPVVSPDGTRLYLYATETGFTYWTEEIDAGTGETLRVSNRSPNPSSGCNARMYPSPDGRSLYLPCQYDRIAVLDLATMQWTESLAFASLEATQPGDGEHLYAIAENGEIAVIAMNDRSIAGTAHVIDLSEEEHSWTIAQATVSRDDETLAVVLADEVVRGPVFARQYRLYDVGSWEEVNRVTLEEPIVDGWLTPDHSGGFLIVEQGGKGSLRLGRDGLSELAIDLTDGSDANYQRTVAVTIAGE